VLEKLLRDRKMQATRARIAETALDLFLTRGFADTTIDQIAAAAGVGRRTIFRHFATKEAILLDHLVVRQEVALRRLLERPPCEPLLESLHAVLRELAEQGYDRRLLAQIRAVIESEPRLEGQVLSVGSRAFQYRVIAALQSRDGERRSLLEIHAATLMTFAWFTTAADIYLIEGRPSLVECFDEVAATCLSGSADLLADRVASVRAPRARERRLGRR